MRVRGFLAFIALFTGISLPSVYALDPDKAITQYAHDIWQVEDGLPQNSAGAVVQTRDGYLWIGTEEGSGPLRRRSFYSFR